MTAGADQADRAGAAADTLPVDLIVAADRGRGIGADGRLPWRLPGDLRHFADTTTHTDDASRVNAVVMGRATWESIPARFRPLPGRRNVVLSRRESLDLPGGVLHARSLHEALDRLADERRAGQIETVFVVGGGEVYADALRLPGARFLYYTRIDGAFDCDTFFPAFEDDYELDSVLRDVRESDPPYRPAYKIERWRRRG